MQRVGSLLNREARPIVEKGLGPDGFNGGGWLSLTYHWSPCGSIVPFERKFAADFGVGYLAS